MILLPSALWSTQWHGVDIAVFSTGNDSPLPLAAATTLLDDGEKARAARFHFDRDRDRWIRSRAILRLVLGERLRTAPESLAFEYSRLGKPSLPAHPVCHFNLSHSGDLAATACSVERVGVDIEQWKDDLPAVSLAQHEFPTQEAAAVAGSTEPLLHFYRLWTAKEAVMKCTGLGMTLPPGSISVKFSDTGHPEMARRMDVDAAHSPGLAPPFELISHTKPGEWVLSAARNGAQTDPSQAVIG